RPAGFSGAGRTLLRAPLGRARGLRDGRFEADGKVRGGRFETGDFRTGRRRRRAKNMANVSVNFDTGLARYLEEAKRFPMLSQEEERDLAVAWLERGDQEALRQLIGSHMRLVVKAARSFSGYGLPLSELIAEGNVGLMQAAQKYDPERG